MSGVSTLGQALSQLERIKDQQSLFTTLSTQLATGKKTQSFTGLGTDVMTSKRARADFKSLDAYIDNIKNADRRVKLMLNAINEFKEQSKNISTALIGFSQETVHQEGSEVIYDDPLTPEIENTRVGMTSAEIDGDFRTLKNLAKNLMGFLTSLLNAKEDERYLLGGAETLTKPLGSTSALDSAISSALEGWKNGTISNDQLLANLTSRTATTANPNAITDTIIGYSAPLSAGNAGNVTTRIGDAQEVDYTALANADPFRDIIVAVSFLMNDNLGPIADAYIPPNSYPGVPDVLGAPGTTLNEMKNNFFDVFNGVMGMVETAIKNVDTTRFNLESVRAQLDETKQSHTQTKSFLLNTISDVEDVDINEVAVRITSLQTSLDASYRVTAKLQELSLTNFLR
jgi:flagellar hook-associated protein 3 FlgL